MDTLAIQRYVRIDEETDVAYEDRIMTEEHAESLNERLARHGEPFRWRVYGTREGEKAA